ncbi:MAG: carboxypeptidase regulatory-like domain-containing protein, partial [Candidatus Hydrogenedentes bacterium]|nr:carboxypeptidase regulatory-like domain-containing protein [Candidatus Hydrogenedentota bacterium]
YSIEGVTPGAHCLWAAAPGRERRYVQYCTLSRPQSELDIGLSRAGKVTGRVVTEDGRPIAYAWIEKPMSHWGAGNGLFEMCDEQGRFEYDGLEFGKEVTLHARIPVYHAACGDPYPAWKQAGVCQSLTCRVREGGETPALTYVLKAAPANGDVTPRDWPETAYLGAVSGIVTSESGQPVRSFHVLLQRPRTDAYASGFASTLEINSWDKGFAFTSDDGAFTLTTRELEPGKYVRVSVVADGYGEAIQDTVLVQPLDRPGGIPPLLFRLPAPAQLMVRVLDIWGNTVPGAHVTLLDPISQRQHRDWIDGRLTGARSVDRETAEDGTVRFDNLGMTSGDIAVCKEGYAFARAIWRGEPVVNFELQPPCSVEGVLFDAWERPLRDGYVTLLRSDAETWDYFSPEDDSYQRVVVPGDAGRVQIGNLPPGRYTLKVDAKPGMVQIGIDPNGEPVTVVPADSHLFYQEITLEEGDAYRFSCPDDSAHLNPEPWQTVGVTPEDLEVRSFITGTWVSANRLPNGNAIYGIEHFGRDGSYERYSYTINSIPFEESGHFKVSGGILWQLSDTAGLIYSECVLSADGEALTLKAVGSDFSNIYHRAQGLDAACAEAVALVGPPPPMPYTPIDPIPVDTDPGIGTFGLAGEY